MPRHTPHGQRLARFAAIVTLSLFAGASFAQGADIYDAAVANPARVAGDLKRDPIDHPAEILRLAGIKPGMTVGDFMGADGYYTELLSYVVGPKGHVLLLNNRAYDDWSEHKYNGRIQGRLSNVEHLTIDAEHLPIKAHSLDAMFMIKVYHDLYWIDKEPNNNWPVFDVSKVLNEINRVLKPGGILVVVDHSAKPGSGTSVAGSLHRIDEQYTLAEFQKHGFTRVAQSDVLRRPDDPRDAITYEGPMVGKTDRFVLVFHKSGTD